MSCGSLCPCQFKWPLDTQGSKRDPINSEKAWLDFAVRLLSREEVGKGRGQETVWSERCKPQWWDKAVGLPWKNPTANPKDTKEVLQTKFTALEKHLMASGRFPKELEEEAQLWNAGKYKELFLLTSLTSLLGKVTSVHSAVIAACEKVEDLKAEVNCYLLSDIKQCLSSTLQATDNFRVKSTSKPMKRAHSPEGKENNASPFKKCRKRELKPKPTSTPSTTSNEKLNQVNPKPPQQSLEILNYAQKLVAKNKGASTKIKVEQKIQPKPPVTESYRFPTISQTSNAALIPEQTLPAQTLSSSPCVTISQVELNNLLQGSNLFIHSPPIVASGTDSSFSNASCLSNPNIPEVHPVSASKFSIGALQTEDSSLLHENFTVYIPNEDSQSDKAVQNFVGLVTEILDSPNTPEFDLLLPPSGHNLVEEQPSCSNSSQNFNSSPLTTANNSPIHQMTIDNVSESTHLLSVLESESENLAKQTDLDLLSTTANMRTSLGRIESSGGSSSECNNGFSDSGYHSDGSNFDLDKICSLEEQDQLWKEDGSFLLDKFLFNLEKDGQGDLDTFDVSI